MSNRNRFERIAPERLTPTESVVGAEVEIAEIKAIMLQNGWFDTPALVLKDEPSEKIYLLDGHHRFAAAQELGLGEIPVLFLDFSELPKFYLYYGSLQQIRKAANSVEKFR